MKENAKKRVMKGLAVMLIVLMAVIHVDTTAFAEEVTTTSEDYYLYLMVDPGETANGFVLEPTCIEIPAGTRTDKKLGEIISNTLLQNRVLLSCTGEYGYISSIRCPEAYRYKVTASTYSMYSDLPEAAFHSGIVKPMNWFTKMLGEFNFTGYSGWMFTVNNAMSTSYNGQPYYYTLGTTVKQLLEMGVLGEEESPVVEMFFTLNMGADMGLCDSYLPKEVTYNESIEKYSYNWAGDFNYVPACQKADRTELVVELADNKDDADYKASLAVLKDIDATELSVQNATYNVSH